MSDYGNFNMFDDESEWEDFFDDVNIPSVSTPSQVAESEMKRAFEVENSLINRPPVIVNAGTKRFKTLNEEELKEIEDCRQADSTRKNTKWGVKLFQEWSAETLGVETDFHTITPGQLNSRLRKFYAEAQPKHPEKRSQTKGMVPQMAQEYHKNTFLNVRAALNRHLRDIKRDIDIVRDKIFKDANAALDGKLKFNLQNGLSRPTKHKAIIENGDLIRISDWLHSSLNPVLLRYRVWYDLSMHFVTRGLEFHHQLTRNSFNFLTDEKNREYAILLHETKEKTHQGGLQKTPNSTHATTKRMYATETDRCPIKSLKLLIEKTDPSALSLFNHCSKAACSSPEEEVIWYNSTPVKKYQFSRFCCDISRNSGCSMAYTAHSIRATAIQAMNDAGFELRHIMYMSGHRNESSVRSYNRECSSFQKEEISDSLSHITQLTDLRQLAAFQRKNNPSATATCSRWSASHSQSTVEFENQRQTTSQPEQLNFSGISVPNNPQNYNSFTNCVFNFNTSSN